MSQTLNFLATSADGTVSPSSAAELPQGFDVGGAHCVATFANYNGVTVRLFLEGSNQETPSSWIEVVAAEASVTTDATVMLDSTVVADQNQVVAFGQFRWLRFSYAFSGGPPVGAGSVSCRISSPGSAGSGNPVSPA